MADFELWDIVKVPFPYTDRPARQRRPACRCRGRTCPTSWPALACDDHQREAHRPWLGDVIISDITVAGLPAASMVRPAKLATIEARDAERPGALPIADRAAVCVYLEKTLAEVLKSAPP